MRDPRRTPHVSGASPGCRGETASSATPSAVVRDSGGRCHGVEAVVDKDLAAALLAERLDAGALLLLTDVAAVEHGYGTPCAGPIHRARAAELRGGQFAAGSMGPKVEAACRFAESTGQVAAIGRLEDAGGLLDGTRGTTVLP